MNSGNNGVLPKITMLALLLLGLTLAGCNSGSDESKDLALTVEIEAQTAEGTLIDSFTIATSAINLKEDETAQLSAEGIDKNGDSRDITQELTWTSSNEDIAKVSSKGKVTGLIYSQELVTITGTTNIGLTAEVEVTVQELTVAAVNIKQKSPDSGNVLTCIDASFAIDVTYTDGSIFEKDTDITWSVDSATTASISDSGILHTYSDSIETTTISAIYEEVTGSDSVIADPILLDSIDIRAEDEVITTIALNVGQRLQLQSQAKLAGDTSVYNADKNINWVLTNSTFGGMTNTGENNGQLLALKPGTTVLTAICGGKETIASLVVSGEANLASLSLNQGTSAIADDVQSITIKAKESVELSLDAHLENSTEAINVTEFATWQLSSSTLASGELSLAGTESSVYKITSTSSTTGEVSITATYDGETKIIKLIIE